MPKAGAQLLEAIAARDMAQSQGLLMAQVDVNSHRDRFGRTALHLAALQGIVGLSRMLVNHGADVDVQEGVGNTALHLAVINWQNLLIRLLLDASANTNIANIWRAGRIQTQRTGVAGPPRTSRLQPGPFGLSESSQSIERMSTSRTTQRCPLCRSPTRRRSACCGKWVRRTRGHRPAWA